MRTSLTKHSLSFILLAALILSVSGCILPGARHQTDKKIPTFYTDSKIVAVRYFHREGDGLRFEELGEDKLEDFVYVMKEYFPSIEEHGDKVYSHK